MRRLRPGLILLVAAAFSACAGAAESDRQEHATGGDAATASEAGSATIQAGVSFQGGSTSTPAIPCVGLGGVASEIAGADGAYAGQGDAGASSAGTLSDDEIRQILVRESIAAYDGPCPCPDSIDAAGHRCGAHSAYSRDGGASPLCSPADVTDDMVRMWRDEHPGR